MPLGCLQAACASRAAYTTRWHLMQSQQYHSDLGGNVVVELLCHPQATGLGRDEILQSSCTSSFTAAAH